MTQLNLLYAQRRRQVLVFFIVGCASLILFFVTVHLLPIYCGAVTATDGETVYLATGSVQLPAMSETFSYASSTDGTTFSPPSLHSGGVAGIAATGGRLYVLLGDGSLAVYGKSPEDWQTIGRQLKWKPIGLASLDNQVTAFAQSGDRAHILTAVLDNATWKESRGFDYHGDNITTFSHVRSGGADWLVWVETKASVTPAADAAGRDRQAEEFIRLPQRVLVAKLTPGGLEMSPAFECSRAIGYAAVGDNAGVHVFYQYFREGRVPQVPRPEGEMREVTFASGKWGQPRTIPLPRRTGVVTEDFTVAVVGGKTFIYSVNSGLGLIYLGVEGVELRGNEVSKPFVAVAPRPEDLAVEVGYGLGGLTGVSMVGGALAAFFWFRRRGEPDSSGGPLYASITDRASAAMLDFLLVFFVVHLTAGEAGMLERGLTTLVCYIIYGSIFEGLAGGQTLGKKFLNLRVVGEDGAPVTLNPAIRRNLFKFVEAVTFAIGFALITKKCQRPGDMFGGTVVLKEWPVPKDMRE